MKKTVLIISFILLYFSSFGQQAVEQKHYADPLVYGMASIVPGLGQVILGEPKTGGLIFLMNVGSVAVGLGGMTMVVKSSYPSDKELETETHSKARIAMGVTGVILETIGAVGWVTTEIYSISNAISMAKRKRSEIALVPTVLSIQTASGVSNAAGFSFALRF